MGASDCLDGRLAGKSSISPSTDLEIQNGRPSSSSRTPKNAVTTFLKIPLQAHLCFFWRYYIWIHANCQPVNGPCLTPPAKLTTASQIPITHSPSLSHSISFSISARSSQCRSSCSLSFVSISIHLYSILLYIYTPDNVLRPSLRKCTDTEPHTGFAAVS